MKNLSYVYQISILNNNLNKELLLTSFQKINLHKMVLYDDTLFDVYLDVQFHNVRYLNIKNYINATKLITLFPNVTKIKINNFTSSQLKLFFTSYLNFNKNINKLIINNNNNNNQHSNIFDYYELINHLKFIHNIRTLSINDNSLEALQLLNILNLNTLNKLNINMNKKYNTLLFGKYIHSILKNNLITKKKINMMVVFDDNIFNILCHDYLNNRYNYYNFINMTQHYLYQYILKYGYNKHLLFILKHHKLEFSIFNACQKVTNTLMDLLEQ